MENLVDKLFNELRIIKDYQKYYVKIISRCKNASEEIDYMVSIFNDEYDLKIEHETYNDLMGFTIDADHFFALNPIIKLLGEDISYKKEIKVEFNITTTSGSIGLPCINLDLMGSGIYPFFYRNLSNNGSIVSYSITEKKDTIELIGFNEKIIYEKGKENYDETMKLFGNLYNVFKNYPIIYNLCNYCSSLRKEIEYVMGEEFLDYLLANSFGMDRKIIDYLVQKRQERKKREKELYVNSALRNWVY